MAEGSAFLTANFEAVFGVDTLETLSVDPGVDIGFCPGRRGLAILPPRVRGVCFLPPEVLGVCAPDSLGAFFATPESLGVCF